MKVKTSELTGAALDYAVAKCESREMRAWRTYRRLNQANYSTDWAQGGPIIDREMLAVWPDYETGRYFASAEEGGGTDYSGDTLLVAAMRCYVASKLGDEVDVPGELLGDDEPPEPEYPEPTGKLLRDYTTDDFNPKMKHWSDK